MKLLKQLPLALTLSLAGAVTTISGLALASDKHEFHEIRIEADGNADAQIFVDINGEKTAVSIPKDALHDEEKLAEALVNVPEDVREKLIASLTGLHKEVNVVKLHKINEEGGDFNWVSKNSDEKVIVVDIDSDGEAVDHKIAVKVIKGMEHSDNHEFIELKGSGKIGVDMIIRMLSHGEYSADELNKLQKALDEKR